MPRIVRSPSEQTGAQLVCEVVRGQTAVRGTLALAETGRGTKLRPRRRFGLHSRQRLRRRLRRCGRTFSGKRLAVHEQLQFGGVENFAFEQSQRDALQNLAVGFEQMFRAVL